MLVPIVISIYQKNFLIWIATWIFVRNTSLLKIIGINTNEHKLFNQQYNVIIHRIPYNYIDNNKLLLLHENITAIKSV